MVLTARANVNTQQENTKDSIGEQGPLLTSCLQILKGVYPRGLTARELVDELAQQDNGFGLTSSLLSSKLNIVFRRLHNERGDPTPQQLLDLPMTRRMTDDKRKRLIYHYVPSEAAEAGAEAAEAETEVTEAGTEATDETSINTPKEESAEPEAVAPLAGSKDVGPSEPAPALESDSDSASDTALSSTSSAPITPSSPKRKQENYNSKPDHHPRKKRAVSSFNPYYDTLVLDSIQLATPRSPTWGQELTELEAPESLDLEVLDGCC